MKWEIREEIKPNEIAILKRVFCLILGANSVCKRRKYRHKRRFLWILRQFRWCRLTMRFFSYGLVGCIQCFDAIFLSILLLHLQSCNVCCSLSLEGGCLLPTWEKRGPDLSAMKRQKICFLLKWQLSIGPTPTLVFDAYTKAWVLRGILLLISRKLKIITYNLCT